jgi:hypothetical protein
MTERKTNKIGFVVNSLLPKAGGRLKSAVLGGTKPPSKAKARTLTLLIS